MKKFALYVVDSNNDDFDKSTAEYQDVVDKNIDYSESNNLEDLLRLLIINLNDGSYSDENWYFIVDVEKGEIIMQ